MTDLIIYKKKSVHAYCFSYAFMSLFFLLIISSLLFSIESLSNNKYSFISLVIPIFYLILFVLSFLNSFLIPKKIVILTEEELIIRKRLFRKTKLKISDIKSIEAKAKIPYIFFPLCFLDYLSNDDLISTLDALQMSRPYILLKDSVGKKYYIKNIPLVEENLKVLKEKLSL